MPRGIRQAGDAAVRLNKAQPTHKLRTARLGRHGIPGNAFGVRVLPFSPRLQPPPFHACHQSMAPHPDRAALKPESRQTRLSRNPHQGQACPALTGFRQQTRHHTRQYPGSTSVLPPFFLRSTSVSFAEVLRRVIQRKSGGRTEVSKGAAGGDKGVGGAKAGSAGAGGRGSEPEIGLKHSPVRARRSVYSLRAGGTGCGGVRSLVTAGPRVGSGAVSGGGKAAGAG